MRVALQEHEFGLDTRVQRVATLRESLQLALQGDARAVGIGLAMHMPIACNARKSGHPRDLADRGGAAHTHEVGSMGSHPETPDGESRKTCAVADHHVVVFHRHSFRLGGAVDIDELREYVACATLREESFRLVRCHVLLRALMLIRPRSLPTSSRVVQK